LISKLKGRVEEALKLTGKWGMLIIKDFLNGDNLGLKEIVRARIEQNNPDIICQVGATLTAYAGSDPTPAMMVMMTCSLMVNGPGLSGIPKKEIFGR
jgi:hypothetical protein